MCIFFFFFFFQIQSLFILQQLQNKYIQLILIMVIGTDVCVCVGANLRVPGGNPPVQLGDHMTISHATPDIEPSGEWRAFYHCAS